MNGGGIVRALLGFCMCFFAFCGGFVRLSYFEKKVSISVRKFRTALVGCKASQQFGYSDLLCGAGSVVCSSGIPN